MIDDELKAFLESGCALIVGFAMADRTPLASRAWGLDVLDAATGRIHLLVVPDDLLPLGAQGPVGLRVAITGAHVESLRSVQLKGTITGQAAATPDDWERCQAYCDDFFGTIERVDRFPKEEIARSAPVRLASLTVEVEEMFDQTPGPGAGAVLGGAT